MKPLMKILTLICALGLWSNAFSYQAKITTHKVCVLNESSYRTIRVQQKSENCDVLYTKLGKDERIAVRTTPQSCMSVIDNFVNNLKAAQWTCKDAFGSGFTIEST